MKKILIMLIFIMIITLTGCKGDKGNEDVQTDTVTEGQAETTAAQDTSQEINDTRGDTGIEETALSLITDLVNADYKKAFEGYKYTSEMNAVANEKFFREDVWGVLNDNYGEFIEVKSTTPGKYQQYDIVSVKLLFESAFVDLNIVFDSEKLIAGIHRGNVQASNPAEISDDIVEKEVRFGKEGWELPGTLTVPKGETGCPVLILVHGSGPNDRDETIGPNKPFRDIAWGLAKKGIGTLRYDKRTYVYNNKFINSAGDFTVYEETVEDASLALEYLKTLDDTDSSKIYILGHSLGGMLIPRIAQITPDAAGYIVMAGAVTPLEELMADQVKYISELDGTLSDQEKSAIEAYEKMRENVKSLDKDSDLKSTDLFGISNSYWLDLKGYNPAESAREITKPLLVLQGKRDYQIPEKEFEKWKKALGNRQNVSYRLYEGLNHLFISGEGKPNPQEYKVPGHVDSSVIEDIANWINR